MAEALVFLIAELEADLERCGPITGTHVSRVYQTGDRFRVCASVQAARPMAWQPRFRTRGEAIDYREAALEVLGRAT